MPLAVVARSARTANVECCAATQPCYSSAVPTFLRLVGLVFLIVPTVWNNKEKIISIAIRGACVILDRCA